MAVKPAYSSSSVRNPSLFVSRSRNIWRTSPRSSDLVCMLAMMLQMADWKVVYLVKAAIFAPMFNCLSSVNLSVMLSDLSQSSSIKSFIVGLYYEFF